MGKDTHIFCSMNHLSWILYAEQTFIFVSTLNVILRYVDSSMVWCQKWYHSYYQGYHMVSKTVPMIQFDTKVVTGVTTWHQSKYQGKHMISNLVPGLLYNIQPYFPLEIKIQRFGSWSKDFQAGENRQRQNVTSYL